MRLGDKVAVITGAARGIGFACAQVFSGEGAKIVIADRLEKEGREAAERIKAAGGDAIFVKCDVTVPKDVQIVIDEALSTFGGIDTCVINAGVAWATDFLEITLDEWNQIMNVIELRRAAPGYLDRNLHCPVGTGFEKRANQHVVRSWRILVATEHHAIDHAYHCARPDA